MRLRSGRFVGFDEKRRRALAAAIPEDLLISEVLVHLPAKSLARCRCVCRSWRAGIAGAAFVRRHLELSRARTPPSVLAIPRETADADAYAASGEISFHRLLLPPPGKTLGTTGVELILEKAWPEGVTRNVLATHCDGLVAIATATDRVFVCNPATGELVALPLGSHNAELDRCNNEKDLPPQVALGFDRWRNRYIVSRYFYRVYGEIFSNEVTGEYSQDYNVGHEVFTLGDGESWELTQDPPHAIGGQRPMSTRRAIYWHSNVPKPRLIRFSLQDRTFGVVSRPPAGWNPFDEMMCLDGKLCYVHAAAEEEEEEASSFHVWLADDGPDELQWSPHFRVQFAQESPVANPIHYLAPVLMNGDKVLFEAVGNKYSSYLSWCTVAAASNDGAVVVEDALDLHHALQHWTGASTWANRKTICIASCLREFGLVSSM
ncbi:unnamed protein product [Urochloa humidicola]